MPAQPAPQKGSNALLIVLAVVFGIILLVGGTVIGGVWYVAHRAKQVAREYGYPVTPEERRSAAREGRMIDVCGMVSKSDVEPVLGAPVESVSGEGSQACVFSPASNVPVRVKITITPRGGKMAMKILEKTMSLVPGGATSGDASGLGDAALMAPMDAAWFVLKGDTLVGLEWANAPGNREQKQRLASKILGKL